jgi:hypothetical protein
VKDSDTGAVLLMKKVYMQSFSKLCVQLCVTLVPVLLEGKKYSTFNKNSVFRYAIPIVFPITSIKYIYYL